MESQINEVKGQLITACLLISLISFIDFDGPINVPVIDLEIEDPSSLTLALSIILEVLTLRFIIEWFRTTIEHRKIWVHRIEAWLIMGFALACSGLILFRYTPNSRIWTISPVAVLFLLFLGFISSKLASAVIFCARFIRSKQEMRSTGMGRFPLAVKAQSISIAVCVIIITLGIIYIEHSFSPDVKGYMYAIFAGPFIVWVPSALYDIVSMDKHKGRRLMDAFNAHEFRHAMIDAREQGMEASLLPRSLSDEELGKVRDHLSAGMSPDSRDGMGWTPLMLAAANGDENLVKLFIEYGGDVNAKNALDRTSLHYVGNYGDVEIAEILLAAGANVNASAPEGTPLHVAAGNGHTDMVEVLLAHGADPALSNRFGETALSAAEAAGSGEAARVIRLALKQT